jgi:hypothetical protein
MFEAKQGATGSIREDGGTDPPVSLNRIEVAETLPFKKVVFRDRLMH